jgi:cellulose synthase operon protein C
VLKSLKWIIIASFLVSGASAADKKKKNEKPENIRQSTIGDVLKRTSGKTTGVERKGLDLPKAAGAAFERNIPLNMESVKPPRNSDVYRIEGDGKEVEYEKLTDKGIKNLYTLVNKFKNSPNRGELWVRLAEAYVEKAKLVKFRKYRDYEAKMEQFESKKIARKPVLDLGEAREYNQQAINLYKLFLSDFPKDKKVSQVLFFLGYNFYELGREDEGAKYYKILADKYTKSPYLDESTFALGDYYFEKNRWKDALKYYARLIDKKESRHYLLALYKSAWCKYRLGDSRAALRGMEVVYMESRRQKGEDSGDEKEPKVNSVRLASEALRDIVPFYAEIGDSRQAEGYFEHLVGAGKAANRMMEKLAYIYSARGNIEGAMILFKRLIAIEPLSPKAFDYQYQVVSSYSSAGKGAIFKRELYDWITLYAPGTDWAKANAKDEKLLAEAYERRERTLRNYVLQQHAAVKQSKNEDGRTRTLEWYKLYLGAFHNAPQVSDMHFYYGELLYDVRQYQAAVAEYNWVLENDEKSKYYKDALINVIASLEKLLPNTQQLLARRDKMGPDFVDPIPMSPEFTKFTATSKKFIQKFPQDPRSPDLEFKIAQIFYLHNNFKESIDAFEPIIKRSPKSQAGQDAISFVLDMYSRRKDYVGLKKVSELLMSNPEIAASPVGGQLKKILVNTKFKNAETLLKSDNLYASGEAFEKFAAENRGSDLAVKALYNAAYSYKKARAVGPALKMYEALMANPDRSPESMKLKAEASKELPPLYQQLGKYTLAAKAYEQVAAANPNSEFAGNYFFNAAVIWDGYGFWDNAIRDYEQYEKREKKSSEKIEVAYYLAEIARKRGQMSQAAKYYEKYISGPATNRERIVESCFKLYEIAIKMGNRSNIAKWRDRTISVQRNFAAADRSIGAKYAAEAKFSQLKDISDQIKAITLPANDKKQVEGIKQKLALIEKLKNEIVQVLRYASGHQIVASYTTLALAYADTAYKIKTAPLPPGLKSLNKEQIAQYQAKVAEAYVTPLEQKAIENYTLAVQNANDLDVYDDYVIAARKNLAKTNPQFRFVNAKIKPSAVVDSMGL